MSGSGSAGFGIRNFSGMPGLLDIGALVYGFWIRAVAAAAVAYGVGLAGLGGVLVLAAGAAVAAAVCGSLFDLRVWDGLAPFGWCGWSFPVPPGGRECLRVFGHSHGDDWFTPAWAGLPWRERTFSRAKTIHPRVGGAAGISRSKSGGFSDSPRVRGVALGDSPGPLRCADSPPRARGCPLGC